MSNPIRRATNRRGRKNTRTIYFTGKPGMYVRAPMAGRVYKRSWGVVVVQSNGIVHRLKHVKMRSDFKDGKYVKDGRGIGRMTGTGVQYKRWRKVNGKWRQYYAMKIVRRPVTKTHRKPWVGSHPVPVGWRYSSGTAHRAWDVGMWTGTKLYAPFDIYVAACNDGVRNNRPGYNPGSGANSNWILGWGRTKKGSKVTLYFQHLSPGIKVRKGQKVKSGALIAFSGNTGNSSGPHLHIHAMKGWQWARYLIYQNVSVAIYGPNKTWE